MNHAPEPTNKAEDGAPSKRMKSEDPVLQCLLLPHSTMQNMQSLRTTGELTTPRLLDAVCGALVKASVVDVRPVSFATPQIRYSLSRCPKDSFDFIDRRQDNNSPRRSRLSTPFVLHDDVVVNLSACPLVAPKHHLHLMAPFACGHKIGVYRGYDSMHTYTIPSREDVDASDFDRVKSYVEMYGAGDFTAKLVHTCVVQDTPNTISLHNVTYAIAKREDDSEWQLTISATAKRGRWMDATELRATHITTCLGAKFWRHAVILDAVRVWQEQRCGQDIIARGRRLGRGRGRGGAYPILPHEPLKVNGEQVGLNDSMPYRLFSDANFSSLKLSLFWENLTEISDTVCSGAPSNALNLDVCRKLKISEI